MLHVFSMQSTSPEGLSFGFVSMCNLCILLQIFYLRLQPVQEDGEVAERNNPACARETFVLELSSKGLGSQLLTPLALVTNVTARLCCRFIKLVPAEPSIPPHQLANMLFPAGADLPALRISTFSAVVSFQAQVFSSSSFIPHLLACWSLCLYRFYWYSFQISSQPRPSQKRHYIHTPWCWFGLG